MNEEKLYERKDAEKWNKTCQTMTNKKNSKEVFLTPYSDESGNLHPIREHPREDDHQRNVVLPIHPGIPAVVSYHYVSVTILEY